MGAHVCVHIHTYTCTLSITVARSTQPHVYICVPIMCVHVSIHTYTHCLRYVVPGSISVHNDKCLCVYTYIHTHYPLQCLEAHNPMYLRTRMCVHMCIQTYSARSSTWAPKDHTTELLFSGKTDPFNSVWNCCSLALSPGNHPLCTTFTAHTVHTEEHVNIDYDVSMFTLLQWTVYVCVPHHTIHTQRMHIQYTQC
jgi:hypothetical protein